MARPTLRTRKPIDQLRVADLEAFPIWEFATDEEGIPGQDEIWVRPLGRTLVPEQASSLSVAARFLSATGREFNGIVGVSTFEGLDIGHAAIVTDAKYVFIPWPGYHDALESCSIAAQLLGLAEDELFPLRYRLLVPVEGVAQPIEGTYAYRKA
jgi:hypothetical protein